MDLQTACRILGVEENTSTEALDATKKKLLKALHPDKHPPQQAEIFTRMTRDVIEAAQFLEKYVCSHQDRKTKSEKTKTLSPLKLFCLERDLNTQVKANLLLGWAHQ
ncbi:hypothetical protein GEOBRER4_n1605 [Citrifermentans bremense]|uniref:J domain-containing protein n=1 Tax=Citrifermentans bremense TaxID=60035 RepID=A0A6S6M577_9BACT|nr:hypothetical protein [Citrifermentans bremense]BCG46791.1 hypothetical protein GEOBRER4_n1605 [Citrifermentans bremense]